MSKKLLRVAVFVFMLALAFVATMYFLTPENSAQGPVQKADAVKVSMPIDLSGKWESAVSKAGTKFVGDIKENKIFIEMYANDGYTGLWYGTFDILQPGTNSMVSSAIQDEDHFVLSTAETKEFIYQKGSLVFEFSVMGTRTTIEMKRV